MKKISLLIFASLLILLLGSNGSAQSENFFIVPRYDAYGRHEIEPLLLYTSARAYWYVEKEWWRSKGMDQQAKFRIIIEDLGKEFDENIYPTLTARFGTEWNPGIDRDSRITIFFHQMPKEVSGYWRSDDEYYRLQGVLSNEREMLYLNAEKLEEPAMRSYLAHEFTHLIAFNQKERLLGVQEETWIQELIAELAPSLLGYQEVVGGSILRERAQSFLSRPTDSLPEWQNEPYDYGTVHLFGQYLVDHYGWKVISDIIHLSATGISGINAALARNGFKKDFAAVFTDWTIALALRDCSVEPVYCYKNSYLQNFRVVPSVYFLPSSGDSTLSVSVNTKDWAGNWYKFLGGHGTLRFEFHASDVQTRVPYIKEYANGTLSIGEFTLKGGDKVLEIPNFGRDVVSFLFIPSIQESTGDFSDSVPSHLLSWTISLKGKESETVAEKPTQSEFPSSRREQIEFLQRRIEELQAQVDALRAKLANFSSQEKKVACGPFEKNLSYGMEGQEVRCLQEFLKAQGKEIYPEGLVTGKFFQFTRAAVIRFQEKYANEILKPLRLNTGTGFVGQLTRKKINESLLKL
jgi:hypothetical protein